MLNNLSIVILSSPRRAGGSKWVQGFCPKMGCGATPRPVYLAGQRLRRRPDKCDAAVVPPQAAGLALSVARPLPTETASLVFGGSPVGGDDKNSRVIFFTFLCGGVSLTLRLLWLCRNNPARGLFQQKKRLSQSGCFAPTDALFPPAHNAFLALLCGGGITTLGARFMLLKRWTPAGYSGVFAVFMPPQCSPCAG